MLLSTCLFTLGSSGSTISVKDVNMSPKSEKSFKLTNGSTKVSSPSLLRRNSRKKKKSITASASQVERLQAAAGR